MSVSTVHTDYHVHTPLCRHAVGTPAEFAAAAVQTGLSELGFADHNPMPEKFDDWRMDLAELPKYLEFVDAVRSAGATVRLGLECDYLPGFEWWIEELAGKAAWDYFIGSVHYIGPGWDVDNPKHISRFESHSVEEIWDLYWKHYVRCIESELFDFVAHPDLPKKFGHRPSGDLRRYYEPAIAALQEHSVAFEINTAGLRKPVNEVYPAREFLELGACAGVPIVINSDAHSPAELTEGFDFARNLAAEAGYRSVLRFERRQRFAVALAVAGSG
jgi:histidinol-phosphatase (PHP family)